MKKQIVVIHGGDTFDTYEQYFDMLKNCQIDFEEYRTGKTRWKNNLGKDLGENYEVIMPDMPSKFNAKYAEWKIWFEKFIPCLDEEIILIGHSLGGIFLAKYLSENNFPKKIIATFLVAAPFNAADSDFSLADFILPQSLTLFEKQSERIILYHSKDDPVVPFSSFENYQKTLKSAEAKIFEDHGHFLQENFPELAEAIRKLASNQ
ncbi:MAG: hypothetical protein UW30_C0011G0011 [Candidatus Giovannonibacteria bacterium GW2011_GWA2_44_13b]|uniref:Uncharacterized protein n=2 Tax=Candidatus Giovannoniibacteriota TaxID=1752738 RepID=A0A0G1H354_9BACT|nr:MAG: hypothetical protein UW30_C0011G0011 [Candidatus Giovannonibacteria bacterium GW2011_GWA2_44_13b]OGF82072.1 MAG: hypothetical protein A2924_01905 [Candidatus Giovannonibacteria bacterium RIFCSPLOWO2_01_FULL_44_16]